MCNGILDSLQARVEAAPDATALLAPEQAPVTFGELWSRIEAVAGGLTEAGVARGDVVAVVLPDGPDLVTAFLGVARAAACAPLNPALTAPEFESALAGLGARALIVEPGQCAPAVAAARALGIAVIDSPAGRAAAPCHADSGDDALLLYTSATSGKAKLVPLTHANLLEMAANGRRALNLTNTDRLLSLMPLFHLQGLLSATMQLLAGGSVVCTSGFDADQFRGWLRRFQPTWYTAGPALLNATLPLINAPPEAPLRFVRSIGAPLPPALHTALERALGVPVLEGYGMTETGVVTANALPPGRRKAGSVGLGAGPEVAILGQNGEHLPAGCVGEIVVRGPSVMRAYRHDAAANRDAFHDGWLRTGDLGRFDDEGFLYVAGRLKEMINRGGEKVLPSEIDSVLAAHPAVAETAAFPVPHPTLGEDIAAAVVLRAGASAGEAELRRFASERLAAFKVPRRIVFVETIPRGATGKPKRADLAAQLGVEACDGPPEENRTFCPASTPVENTLAQIWQRILRTGPIGIHDDFFARGGDSLGMTLLLVEVELECGVDRRWLEESEFASRPTIAALARVVAEKAGAATVGDRRGEPAIVALQPHGAGIPFFCFPGADENPYYFRDLARNLGSERPFLVVRDTRPLPERGSYTLEQAAARFRAALRRVQPGGPYLLGGHCFGGVLAFEIARQLLAGADEVGLLALFEVPTPGYPKVLRHAGNYWRQSAASLRALLRRESYAGLAAVPAHLKLLLSLARRRSASQARRLAAASGIDASPAPDGAINTTNAQVARIYRPGPLACPIAVFLAAGERHSTLILDDPRLGWRDFAARQFSVYHTPGKATTIFEEPNASVLAAQLGPLLEHAAGNHTDAHK